MHNMEALHPGVDPAILTDYEVDDNYYDKARNQGYEVLHNDILVQ
jgi:hypothetical protein